MGFKTGEMIHNKDVNWQFWRKCYCALDRELFHLFELKPTVNHEGQFCLEIILNSTTLDYSSIKQERIAWKKYALETTKIDILKEWEKYINIFYDEYFEAKDANCRNYKGMNIRL